MVHLCSLLLLSWRVLLLDISIFSIRSRIPRPLLPLPFPSTPVARSSRSRQASLRVASGQKLSAAAGMEAEAETETKERFLGWMGVGRNGIAGRAVPRPVARWLGEGIEGGGRRRGRRGRRGARDVWLIEGVDRGAGDERRDAHEDGRHRQQLQTQTRTCRSFTCSRSRSQSTQREERERR